MRRSGLAMPATAFEVFAVRWKPGGSSMASSPCDIQTLIDAGISAKSGVLGIDDGYFSVPVFALVCRTNLASR